MQLQILHRQELKDIPSASGIESYRNSYYVMGDNAPWLYKLDSTYAVVDKIQIASIHTLVNNQIPKKVKPDFEAMTLIKDGCQDSLLIFGSGSKSPSRDVLVSIVLSDKYTVSLFSLETFYSAVRQACDLCEEDFNIEAAIASDTHVYLFNRGKNRIITFSTHDFLNYIKGSAQLPSFTSVKVELPRLEGLIAGFSGATFTKDGTALIFTASVENTSNWIDDGEVLGSFIGIIPLDQLREDYTPRCVLLANGGHTMKVKVESITLSLNKAGPETRIILVTDSDGAASEVIEVLLLV